MSTPLDRRTLLRRTAAAAALAATGGGMLGTLGRWATGAAGDWPDGPYGPLQPANADGLMLPEGFTSRLIAVAGQPVAGTGYTWHRSPDGAACAPAADGGWYLVSNSEASNGKGGAGVVRFAPDGTIVDAYRILDGTSRNCSGGFTPWGTYLSGEENDIAGRVFECDPTRPGQGIHRPALGLFDHEMAAVDPLTGWVYMVEDDPLGRLYRFRPDRWGDLSSGVLEVARVEATAAGAFVHWTPTSPSTPDRSPTSTLFPGGEGAWIERGRLYFTTKVDVKVWRLDLAVQQLDVFYDAATSPAAPLNAVDNLTGHTPSGDLYVAEDGGNLEVCIIPTAGPAVATVFLRFVGHDASEVTGVAFNPDGTRCYVTSQRGVDGNGRTYEVSGPFRHRTRQVPHTPRLRGRARRLLVASGSRA